jgi:hypothetical protein
MLESTHTWTCDNCGVQKTRKSPGAPAGWRRLTLNDDIQTIHRADFCDTKCRDEWLEQHGLTKAPESLWGSEPVEVV